MNLNCQNCEGILAEYLSDIPIEWRDQITTVICASMELDCQDDCEDVEKCIKTASLSQFVRKTNFISITYTNEIGVIYTREFNFTTLMDNLLIGIDPKCIATQEAWDVMTYTERFQAILDKDCDCCPTTTTTTTSTTTTTTQAIVNFELRNYTNYPDPFPVILTEEVTDEDFIDNNTTGPGDIYIDTYPCTENE